MVIVDTTVWIDYWAGAGTPEAEWLDAAMDRQRLGVTDIIVCELLQGVRDEAETATVERELAKFEIFNTGGVELAKAAAQNYRALRGRGYTVRKTVDCLIATFCLREGHSLLHRDRDFDPFERFLNLSVIHPA
jgi:predicted nucleic acid-binding protein